MDILISSNLERFLYEISGKDDNKINEYMNKLSKEGKYEIDDNLKELVKESFYGGYCDDERTLKTIKATFEKYNYLIDTHTAVAKAVYDDYVEETKDNTSTVIASTASPYKFLTSVLDAVCPEGKSDNDFEMLDKLSECSGTIVPKALKMLKDKEIRFSGICDKDLMKDTVKTCLDM
jgi:threonine synthase